MTDRERIVQLEQNYKELLENFLALQKAVNGLQEAVIQLQNLEFKR